MSTEALRSSLELGLLEDIVVVQEVVIEAAVVEENIRAEADMVVEIAIVEVDLVVQTEGDHGTYGVDDAEIEWSFGR